MYKKKINKKNEKLKIIKLKNKKNKEKEQWNILPKAIKRLKLTSKIINKKRLKIVKKLKKLI